MLPSPGPWVATAEAADQTPGSTAYGWANGYRAAREFEAGPCPSANKKAGRRAFLGLYAAVTRKKR